MGLTSEEVHWIGWACFALVALALMVHAVAPKRMPWAPWLLPALLLGYGLESAVDPWIHGRELPQHYALETSQHLVQGSVVLLAGVVEWARLRGRLLPRAWGLVTPFALLVVAGVFLVHAQHDVAVSPALLVVQHRAFAVCLTVAALARAAAVLVRDDAVLRAGWLFPLLAFGLLLLVYTERDSPQSAAHGSGSHDASAPGEARPSPSP